MFAACLLVSGYCFSQSGCSKFRDGKFRFTDPSSKKTCIITRDGDSQTERMETSEETYEFNLVWQDSCTYTITPTSSTIQRKKELLKLGSMTVKISQVTDTSYVQVIRVASSPKFKRRDTVFLIKDK